METAIFAAGCFWGVQYYMNIAPGVLSSEVGYMGGHRENPEYNDVKTGDTGHLEVIKVEFNPLITTYTELCMLFFEIHNPAQTDGQGEDIGSQYLSAIFYNSFQQKEEAQQVIEILRGNGYEVNTILMPAMGESAQEVFWKAEEYHQHYYQDRGGSPYCHFRVKKF